MSDPALLLTLASRLLIAIALGAAIGLERQWRLRTAGIRTNALVAAGSALFVMVGANALDNPHADPTRVAAQVVSGIGFLGAGVILRDGLNIRGLTTAATLWCAAAIGSLAGAGLELVGVIGAVAIIGTNTLLRPLSRFINRRTGESTVSTTNGEPVSTDYVFEVVTTEKSEPRVRALVLQAVDRPELTLRSLDVRADKASRMHVLAGISAVGSTHEVAALEVAVQRISLDPKVISSRWWTAEADED